MNPRPHPAHSGDAAAALAATLLVLANTGMRAGAACSAQLVGLTAAARSGVSGSWLVALSGGLYFAVEILAAPLLGRVADRRGPTRVLRAGPVLGAIASLASWALMAGRDQPWALIGGLAAARAVEGAGAGCAVPTTLTLLARETDARPTWRARLMGAFEIGSMVGMFAGMAIAGPLFEAYGTAAFAAAGAIYALALLLVVTMRSSPSPKSSAQMPPIEVARHLLRSPAHRAFLTGWVSVNAVVGLWLQHAPHLLTHTSSGTTQRLVGAFSPSETSKILLAYGVLFLLGTLAWVTFAPSLPRARQMRASLVGMVLVVPTLAALNHGAPSAVVVPLAAVCVLVETGFTPAALAYLAEETRALDGARATTLGAYSLFLGVGQLAGILLGGLASSVAELDGLLVATLALAMVAWTALGRAR